MTEEIKIKELDEAQSHLMTATFSMVKGRLPAGMACNWVNGCSKENAPADTGAIFVFGEDAVEDLAAAWKFLTIKRDERKTIELIHANAEMTSMLVDDNERLTRELAEMQKVVAGLLASKGEG